MRRRECEQEWTFPGTCEVLHVRRALEYTNLSETAVVIFAERLDDYVDLLYHGKYIGK